MEVKSQIKRGAETKLYLCHLTNQMLGARLLLPSAPSHHGTIKFTLSTPPDHGLRERDGKAQKALNSGILHNRLLVLPYFT